jgi:starch synthase
VKILFATSEAVPFAKTGGLADVSGALPIELAKAGQDVTLIMPAYRQVFQAGLPIEHTGVSFEIAIGNKSVRGAFLRSHLPGSQVAVIFVQQDGYFDRDQLYTEQGSDYRDNCERFVFFCRATMEAIRLLNLQVDVIHCNDWQTGLIPAYQKIEYRGVPGYEQLTTILTIHNIAFQGTFWHWDMLLTGLDWKYFNWHQMEFFGNLNLLKSGLAFADAITTVSPRYAEEIQSPEFGCGLEGVLTQRSNILHGILNGVDYTQWDPQTDAHLPQNYGPLDSALGKAACKAALQTELGLPADPKVPLLGFVGRLTDQKGVDLIAGMMQEWVQSFDLQWVLLGSGEAKYHDQFSFLAERNSKKVVAKFGFSDPLAHRIEAGADMFLMPSRFEPCGLSQMYSLKYGTVPIVRATGGLADTITDVSDEALQHGAANGYTFAEANVRSLSEATKRACGAFANPELWQRLINNGMRQDWSWSHSAKQYVELYQQLAARATNHETAAAR